MKSYKDYLTESKKTYEFKVKVAGDCPKDFAKQVKTALSRYHVEACSPGKNTPIQEIHSDFPNHKNVGISLFNVTLSYPTTSAQVLEAIAEKTSIASASIRVRTQLEEDELAINYKNMNQTGKAVLGTDYENENHQDLLGDKQTTNFLKELSKVPRTTGTQYTGANDEILAKSSPSEKGEGPAKLSKKANLSPIGSRKVKLPTAGGVK